MNENQYFSYLDVGLPEAVEKMKLCGELEAAVDCIDQRLACTNLPENLRYCLLAEREMIRRMPADFPYTRAEAMDIIRAEIPSYTEEEFDAAVACGQIRFIYLHGEMRIFNRFFSSMCKSVPEFRDRTKVALNGGESSGRGSKGDLRLNRSMRIMKEQGALANRITIRATVKVEDAAFKPGMLVRVHVPIAAACEQQSDIRIESMFPENGQIAPEDAEQRTVYWEENMQENHEFSVTYSYVHTAKWHDVETVLHGMPMSQGTMQDAGSACCEAAQRPSGVPELPCLKPEALAEYLKDTAELAPHIEFTPYIRALTEACAQGCTTPLEKAKSFYDFITKNFRYTYMPAYFTLDSIAENCARSFTGDCGVFALLFITMCRCAGIPAEWQSGFAAEPEFVGGHDWARFYAEPFGWLFADPSFGIGARR
ncbi:MAG: transglutaminase-like domain-containing protein, partial [Oliverpabstia sp.]|nr:transglutaminase-like domain-containing protein [Oliverpabstia sp.]